MSGLKAQKSAKRMLEFCFVGQVAVWSVYTGRGVNMKLLMVVAGSSVAFKHRKV